MKISSLIVLFAGLIFLSSCRNPCKEIACINGSTCEDGTCICPTGYEGASCETRVTQKFAGLFSTAETCNGTTFAPYDVTIAEHSTALTTIQISNLYEMSGYYGISSPVQATVEGNSITLASQSFTTSGGATLTISGTGSLSADSKTITLNYAVTVGSSSETCSTALTRK